MRRKVGASFHKSPAQKMGAWSSRNLLGLMAALIAAIAFWFAVDWGVDFMLNFLATGGDESTEKPFDSNDGMWIAVKLVGSLLILLFISKTATK